MSLRNKNILYTAILLASVYAVWYYRSHAGNGTGAPTAVFVEGQTMGTTYHLTYFDKDNRNFKKEIDSLLLVVNKSINTYDSLSEVSIFNRGNTGIAVNLPYLLPPLRKGREVFVASNGAFDPTVMPLVNAWGFGPATQTNPDKKEIETIMSHVGFEKIRLEEDSVKKLDPKVQLDFGGIGQGYGADVITDFLRSKGISDMLVELGGEGMAVGKNLSTGKPWEIGILDPNSTRDEQFFKAYISLSDLSFTTSGNYFNYREVNGKKYSHTIDPETGYPAQKAILSASVFSKDCTTADAWGTAFMVMGHERAIELLKDHPELQALLMYTGNDGKVEVFTTDGIRSVVKIEK